ncbi:MAG: carbamoyltransferase [Desulfarculaceae bacterium]|nr:carbamoyltransferase [Desulfarculaceae bacterium]MCF8072936.1 carbamoyltransferase [Desulfarculaceae bacterium]MCF8101104.1 carbamoyltransferase [Desulfarculaceae bacterium]MCF8115509.1 carbamoyltransferase [Desulfarculaceae bacterium]
MNILGISAYYHDSAACLLQSGRIVAAAQEERFTRKKHDHDYPAQAIEYCLEAGGIGTEDLDLIVFYDKPFLKFERILETYLAFAPAGLASFLQAMPLWLKEKLWLPDIIKKKLDYKGKVLFPQHHQSHAASAFYPSPFEEAAFLTLDGVGEWTTTSWGVGKGNHIDILAELKFPHSLGLLYSAFTYFTGFRVNSGEYKVMGLAPYGQPKYVDVILDELMDLKPDGSFKLNMRYFDYCAGLTMTNKRFADLFGGPPRKPESKLTQREMDLAASVQKVTEMAVSRIVKTVAEETGQKNLVMSGGVALNCVANGRLLGEGLFDNIWIQPAAGDAGGALGAALYAWHQYLDNPREVCAGMDHQAGSYLGPEYSEEEIAAYLDRVGAEYRRLDLADMPAEVAGILASEKVVGWFQGRMEFGPRALGNRSIIGDARSPKMQRVMNLKIKYRESFRPFAPSVLAERVGDYFEMDVASPYMLLVAGVNRDICRDMDEQECSLFGIEKLNVARSTVPAITHVDYSARVQTVHAETNPLYHQLISAFDQKTGCGVIVNTSFNVRGEPIVCDPSHAYTCFMRTEMDYLVMGPFILDKVRQPDWHEDGDWRQEFELD